MNVINIIHPYKYPGNWVFDDLAVGLVQEPFVSGADEVIEALASAIPDANAGFALTFSASPFPGYQAVFEWRREESGGNWYYGPDLDADGWLCPALLKYFDEAPARIFAQFTPRKEWVTATGTN